MAIQITLAICSLLALALSFLWGYHFGVKDQRRKEWNEFVLKNWMDYKKETPVRLIVPVESNPPEQLRPTSAS